MRRHSKFPFLINSNNLNKVRNTLYFQLVVETKYKRLLFK